MWIRSQNEDILVNLDCIAALKHFNCFGTSKDHGPSHAIAAYTGNGEDCGFELGRYYSEKRVREILEEVEDEIVEDSCTIYYMPAE